MNGDHFLSVFLHDCDCVNTVYVDYMQEMKHV